MVTRIGSSKRQHQIMEVTNVSVEGNATYKERTITGFAWACDSCGLIWEKKWHAEGCTGRGHLRSFEQRYGGYVENGIHRGGTSFTRQSIGRMK